MTDRPRDEENGGVGSAPVPPQRYDPVVLLAQVTSLLLRAGLRPRVRTRDLPTAYRAAVVLLRTLDVEPIQHLSPLGDPRNVDLRRVRAEEDATTVEEDPGCE